MDDILVIILTLVVAAIGALGQRKKKTNKTQPAGVQNESSDFWDVIMRQEEQPIMHQERGDVSEKEEIVEEEVKPKYQFAVQDEGTSDLEEEEIKKRVVEKRKVLIEGEEFSLRKAVIYNEILNRKYT